jgi:beta-lactam-binding protein with PASTA domain
MKNKLRPSFSIYSLTLTWAILGIIILVQPAVVKAHAEESTTTEVPDVVNMSQTDALSEIMEAGLTLGRLTQASSEEVSPGNVMGQSPDAETSVAPGSSVNLIISTGPAVTVPNVVGMSQTDAQDAITSAGLSVGLVTPTSSPTISAGKIIGQNPNAKTAVPQGSAVNLILSSGPP